ncbi:metallopeptidase, partial [Moniliophthora roreri]
MVTQRTCPPGPSMSIRPSLQQSTWKLAQEQVTSNRASRLGAYAVKPFETRYQERSWNCRV